MNVAVLVALKIAQDRNRAASRRRRREREEERRKRNAPDNSSSRYSSKEYSETEYLNMVITEDPILSAFFKELEKKGEQVDEKDAEEIRKIVEEKLKLQSERVEKIRNKLQEIKDAGLNVVAADTYFAYRTTVGEKVLDSGNRAFGEKGEYASVKRSFELEYKGISLSREWFKGDKKNENPFEIKYNRWAEEHKELESKIQELEEAIRVQERKIKFAIFHKEEKQEELEILQANLERLKKEQSYGESLKSQSDIFAEITPEQKELLEEYFTMVDECKEKGKEVDCDIEKYNQIKEISYHYSYNRQKSEAERNKWQRALDSLIEDGEASEELLDAIDTIISEENIGYKKYSEGKDRYTMQRDGYSERFTNLVAWYLENRRERIVTKALHRKEEAYKALEIEHKKLCEMAGLVEEAQKIDDRKGDEGHGEHDE